MPELHLTERIRHAIPQDPVLATYGVGTTLHGGKATPVPPKEFRASIFHKRMPGDSWRMIYATLGNLLTGDIVSNPSPSLAGRCEREEAKKKNKPHYGAWEDSAGQLIAALQPRSRSGFYPTLAIAEQDLHIVCIQRKRGTIAKLGTATQVTGTLSRGELSWVRQRGNAAYEFGFRDGSWATIDVFKADDIADVFPNLLGKKAPIPW